jgi:hypothetical protein
MKNKSMLKPVVRTEKQASDDLFWAVASRERDPEKNLRITQEISDVLKEHDINVRRNSE